VFIGGVACYLLYKQAGRDFRRTKDLDIVLCAGVLTKQFTEALFRFISEGGYEIKENATGARNLYRYTKPQDKSYPHQLEFFSVNTINQPEDDRYTPIKMNAEYISLSALLLEPTYYYLLHLGKSIVEGFSVLRAEYIIVYKAKAWLDLSDRSAAGGIIRDTDIKKHIEDVFRMLSLLSPELRVSLPSVIKADMQLFVSRCAEQELNDLIEEYNGISQIEALDLIRQIYALGEEA